jgi:ATP-dependent exoDNAse (exonuclease V) beta subunit
MTVHGSKGLEFPVVVLAGLNADRDVRSPLVAWGELGPEIRFGSRANGYFETAGYAAVRQSDERFEEAEQRRLLYVAATRAQDHLVVSLHHKPSASQPSHAQLLHGVCAGCDGLHVRPDAAQLALAVDPDPGAEPMEATDAAARWAAHRAALLARVRDAGVASPSRLGPEPVEAEEAVRVPGRGEGGSARGRAVHAALQAVSWPGAEDVDAVARLEAEHEGLGERAGEVAAIVRAALEAPVVRRARAAPRHWRELIDLAFEDAHGRLVVIDYKTDVAIAPARHRAQVAAYAAALARATRREVTEGWLVFAGPDGATEHRIGDLPAAVAEVEALLSGEGPGPEVAHGVPQALRVGEE